MALMLNLGQATEREKALYKRNNELREEIERLQRELDRVDMRPPARNPIHLACLSCHDQSAEKVGFTNFEFAYHSEYGDLIFVFDVEALTPEVLKVLNYLEENEWYLGKSLRDLDRPFPQEHSGEITICAMPPHDCDALNSVDPALWADWETLHRISSTGWGHAWFPVSLRRTTEEIDRQMSRR